MRNWGSSRGIFAVKDFDGQKKAERLFQIIIILFAVVGFIWGYITQFFSQTLYILLAGVVLSSLLTLIPWGMYRKQEIKWQPVRDQSGGPSQPQPASSGGNSSSQSKSKKKKLKD